MPDAMETIFEAALDLGKLGGVSFLYLFLKNKMNNPKLKTKQSICLCSFILIHKIFLNSISVTVFVCRLRRLWEI